MKYNGSQYRLPIYNWKLYADERLPNATEKVNEQVYSRVQPNGNWVTALPLISDVTTTVNYCKPNKKSTLQPMLQVRLVIATERKWVTDIYLNRLGNEWQYFPLKEMQQVRLITTNRTRIEWQQSALQMLQIRLITVNRTRKEWQKSIPQPTGNRVTALPLTKDVRSTVN